MVAVSWMPRSMKSATATKSCSTKPRVVMAGAPMRMPPGTTAERSPGTEFLLRVMAARSSTASTRAPSRPLGRRSSSTRWLSVPPETNVYPSSSSRAASAWLLLTTCCWYTAKAGSEACLSATASAPMVWLCGPPCSPGNTALLIAPSKRSPTSPPRRKKIMPPRGPRSDLCVVVVTMSQYSKGLGATPAATRPLTCAISASSSAPTESAISRKRA
mmetsp:Transcript_5467/g.19949  ORF Transcript_5467/g.19949 Transcript_5467/m.19949 type:complete len:216 (-) Transcript_5467:845-1492(-)